MGTGVRQVSRRRFTVHHYHRMGEAGILHEEDRGELIEPQPDVVAIQPRDFTESLPIPEDVLLLVEVSDATLAHDRDLKPPLNARAGIGEVWIVNLPVRSIEQCTDPSVTASGA